MATGLPDRAQVVIAGGGIVGCSVAYHLTRRGITDVVLIEQSSLTSGTTWHAAGLVSQLKATHSLTKLATYTARLFEELGDETGQPTGYRAPVRSRWPPTPSVGRKSCGGRRWRPPSGSRPG